MRGSKTHALPLILGALSLACMVAFAPTARAFAPDVLWGAGAQYRSPQEARAFVMGEMEVLDYLGVRVEGAVGASNNKLKGVVWAGPTLSLDITNWAPALFAGIGWRASPNVLTATLRAELHRYVNLHSAIGLGIGAEWAQQSSTQLSATLGYFYRM